MKLKNLRSIICLLLVVCAILPIAACFVPSDSSSYESSPSCDHEFNYSIRTKPTFTDKGLLVGECIKGGCDRTTEVELPALNYTDYTFESKRESCEVEGEVEFKITIGGQYFIFNAIAPAGHYFNNKPVDKNKVYDLDSPDVAGVTIIGKGPSCEDEKPSQQVFECEICGDYYYITVKKNHKKVEGDNGRVIKEPTCKNEGIIIFKCKYCNGDITEILPEAHNYDYTLTEENGEYVLLGKCKACGGEIKKPAENVKKQVVPATCENVGSETVTCVVDGKTLEFKKELPVTRHKYLGKEVDLEPLPITIFGKYAECLNGLKPASCKTGDMIKGIFNCSDCGLHFYAMVRLAHTAPEGATGEYECTVCHQLVTGE